MFAVSHFAPRDACKGFNTGLAESGICSIADHDPVLDPEAWNTQAPTQWPPTLAGNGRERSKGFAAPTRAAEREEEKGEKDPEGSRSLQAQSSKEEEKTRDEKRRGACGGRGGEDKANMVGTDPMLACLLAF